MSRRTLNLDDTLYDYVLAHSLREHPAQLALREATRSHRFAGMQISPEQGQFMALLVKLIGAKRAIEIGVFTGYSALTVALALPDDGSLLAFVDLSFVRHSTDIDRVAQQPVQRSSIKRDTAARTSARRRPSLADNATPAQVHLKR